MRLSIISILLALLMLLAGLTGCARESANTDTPTTTAPTSSTTQKPQEPADPQVQYDHCGLIIKMEQSFTAAPDKDDETLFTFQREDISGSVRFGALAELGDGAATSLEYAEALEAEYGEDNAWIGCSTGIGYYVVSRNDSGTLVQCLYIYNDVCWLVEAQSTDSSLTEQMTKIVGRCGWNAQNIPEL